jgi:FAD/FMN-containing dehydrogenase
MALRMDMRMVQRVTMNHPPAQAVVKDCWRCLDEADRGIRQIRDAQRLAVRHLAGIVGRANIFTNPFAINAHVTDATNWRLCLPVAVVRPTREDHVPRVIRTLAEAGLRVIPRGGGTGHTDGGVPLADGCVIVNTERLNRIHGIETCVVNPPALPSRQVSAIHLGTGVITDEAITYICASFANRGEEPLMVLEHFDDAYVRAIGYKVKAPRQDLPKAVLLADMVAHTRSQIRRGIERLAALLAGYPNTHLFVAEDERAVNGSC